LGRITIPLLNLPITKAAIYIYGILKFINFFTLEGNLSHYKHTCFLLNLAVSYKFYVFHSVVYNVFFFHIVFDNFVDTGPSVRRYFGEPLFRKFLDICHFESGVPGSHFIFYQGPNFFYWVEFWVMGGCRSTPNSCFAISLSNILQIFIFVTFNDFIQLWLC
jgi:hypothetical protein